MAAVGSNRTLAFGCRTLSRVAATPTACNLVLVLIFFGLESAFPRLGFRLTFLAGFDLRFAGIVLQSVDVLSEVRQCVVCERVDTFCFQNNKLFVVLFQIKRIGNNVPENDTVVMNLVVQF